MNPVVEIKKPVPVPELPSLDFPAVPSARYFYYANDKITACLNKGTLEEQEFSLRTWYAAKESENYILTPYARQGNIPVVNGYLDRLSSSMKNQIRQVPVESEIISPYTLRPFLQSAGKDLDDFIRDTYLFPYHPSANFVIAIDIAIHRDRIFEYLHERGITHLDGHNFEYYPRYYLFFILTRFASYPLNSGQVILAQLRANGSKSQKEIIDSVFELELTVDILNLVTLKIMPPGAAPGWESKAKEYLRFFEVRTNPDLNYNYISNTPSEVLKTFLNWTDQEIIDLCISKKLEIPKLNDYSTRKAWIMDIINLLRTYRST